MGNLTGFNIQWDKVTELVEFTPLAEGKYGAKVTKSEIKKTKKGDDMASLTFDILGTNRKVFATYMLTHANSKAVSAGLGGLKSLAMAMELDYDQLQDLSELHGTPIGVKLKVESSEQYGDQNRVTSYFEFSEDLLDREEESEAIQVDAINEEPEMIDDVPEFTPESIQAMKKAELLQFVKDRGINIVLTGKKISEVKDDVVNALFAAEVIDDSEDIILED